MTICGHIEGEVNSLNIFCVKNMKIDEDMKYNIWCG